MKRRASSAWDERGAATRYKQRKERSEVSNVGKRLALLLATIVGVLLVPSGIALAATVTCQIGAYCLGTKTAGPWSTR
jgi:hypothetical protein